MFFPLERNVNLIISTAYLYSCFGFRGEICRWDYGYQIAQISNRTTLADGNTWNHEHIALLGKILVSNITASHNIVKHLADYVLVWSTRFVGNHGDDIAKSPHMARIAGSVYKDINPNLFGQDRNGQPSKMMAQSLVYNLVLYGADPNVPPFPPGTYAEAYTTSHKMVSRHTMID
jgi:dolichyl-diphosphooligosaccharide--protein glycosyltransferase